MQGSLGLAQGDLLDDLDTLRGALLASGPAHAAVAGGADVSLLHDLAVASRRVRLFGGAVDGSPGLLGIRFLDRLLFLEDFASPVEELFGLLALLRLDEPAGQLLAKGSDARTERSVGLLLERL